MIIRDGCDLLEMTVLEQISLHEPRSGDTEFAIRIQVEDFTGQGTTWIDLSQLQRFAAELSALESKRQGSAQLHSMSPEEFNLCISSVDQWGHMAVSGRLRNLVQKNGIEFGFEFCPSFLLHMTQEFESLARFDS